LERARLGEIEKTTTAYREQLRKRVTDAKRSSSAEAVILKYLDRYANHLLGHPAQRDENGNIIAVVERTNNLAEHYFGTDKQNLRRRLGRAHLGRDLEDQPAQAALASSLRHPDYVRVLCGSLEHLPTAFAGLDQAQQEAAPLQRSNRDTGLLKRIRALIADERQSKNDGIIDPIHVSWTTPQLKSDAVGFCRGLAGAKISPTPVSVGNPTGGTGGADRRGAVARRPGPGRRTPRR
jgi:hypothetical protein